VVLPGGVKLEMVFVPPGNFQMGNAPFAGNAGGHFVWSDGCVIGNIQAECPHNVTLTKWFQIGKYPVTQRQWQAVMGNNPSHFFSCGLDCPVEQVSWNDSQEFIKKLNTQVSGAGFRLPSDAEWEFAARAGTSGDFYGDLDEIAWYVGNGGGTTHPVGKKMPNAFGLYDMIGQV